MLGLGTGRDGTSWDWGDLDSVPQFTRLNYRFLKLISHMPNLNGHVIRYYFEVLVLWSILVFYSFLIKNVFQNNK